MEQHTNDLNAEPVEIAEGVWWVGMGPGAEILYPNPYIRRFEGSKRAGDEFNLLIDPASGNDLDAMNTRIDDVLGDVSEVSAVFINHQDPDMSSTVASLLQNHIPDAPLLCTEDTGELIHNYCEVSDSQFVHLEDYPGGMELPTGQVVKPVAIPFCHFLGSTMLYDPSSRVLFSGDLFSSVTDPNSDGLFADESDWAGMRAFHQIYMPTREAVRKALDEVRQFTPSVEMIAPQHGRIIGTDMIDEFIDRLYELEMGVDVFGEHQESDQRLQAWTSVVRRLVDVASRYLDGDDIARLAGDDAHLQGTMAFVKGEPTVRSGGREAVQRLVRLITDDLDVAEANSVKFAVVRAAGQLGVPTPRIELDETATNSGSDEAPLQPRVQFEAV